MSLYVKSIFTLCVHFTYLQPVPMPDYKIQNLELQGQIVIDLNYLQGALSCVAEKWYSLGLYLELSSAELHEIELKEIGRHPSYYLNGMLKLWLQK